jgi:tetratricopeptide (TPR) repeat protein
MKKVFLFLFLINPLFIAISQKRETPEEKQKRQNALEEQYITNCANKPPYNYYFYSYDLAKREECLKAGLKIDPTFDKFWHEMAMPYFKARKYEVGMKFIDKAVQYNPREQQPYRAFIKCIFAKTYQASIADFQDCIKKFGNGYVMDHTYNFYIALCCLQLNEFQKAEKLLKEYAEDIFKNRQELVHPTLQFYRGIALYEQKKYEEAIVEFDKAIKVYPNFSDAKHYKYFCLEKIGKVNEAISALKESKEDYKLGYTINEDNTVYEMYPYQIAAFSYRE